MKNKERWTEIAVGIAIAILGMICIYIGTLWKSM